MVDRLPRAIVPSCREKLEGYLLNPEHELGRHKARVGSALGIRQRDWDYPRDRIQAGVVDAPIASVRQTRWGSRYEVAFAVEGLNGLTRQVLTVWLVESDEPPRLVTGIASSAHMHQRWPHGERARRDRNVGGSGAPPSPRSRTGAPQVCNGGTGYNSWYGHG